MAETKRFLVHDHYVVDTKQNRHAPFGEHAGALQVAERLNATEDETRLFAWVEGKPKGYKRAEAE